VWGSIPVKAKNHVNIAALLLHFVTVYRCCLILEEDAAESAG